MTQIPLNRTYSTTWDSSYFVCRLMICKKSPVYLLAALGLSLSSEVSFGWESVCILVLLLVAVFRFQALILHTTIYNTRHKTSTLNATERSRDLRVLGRLRLRSPWLKAGQIRVFKM